VDDPSILSAALKRGVDDLQSLLTWLLRDQPHALARAQREYQKFCVKLYRKIARAQRLREAA
jgi:hypothetical protein